MEEKDRNVSWYKTRPMGAPPVMEDLLKWEKKHLILTLEGTGFLKWMVLSMKEDGEKDMGGMGDEKGKNR